MARDVTALVRNVTTLARDVTVLVRDVTALARDVTALVRDVTVLVRDVTVLARDVTALARDVTALDLMVNCVAPSLLLSTSPSPPSESVAMVTSPAVTGPLSRVTEMFQPAERVSDTPHS